MGDGGHSFLAEITIRDFAIIDRLHIDWTPGFTVLTGETGAGKSIIVDALGVALGERASADWIRSGSERASVELIVALPEAPAGLVTQLTEAGVELDADQLILTRDIQATRSTSRVNGRAVPAALVQQLAESLVDIHSQASHLTLLRVREHLNALDRFANLLGDRSVLADSVRQRQAVRQEITRLQEQARRADRELALLQYEVAEIDAVGPALGEEEPLVAARSRLTNVLRLQQAAQGLHAALQGGDEQRGALDLLTEAADRLRDLANLDPECPFAGGDLDEVVERISDLDRTVRRYAEAIEDDPAALEAADDRLHTLTELKRKYGATLEAVVAYRDEAAHRLDEIEHQEEHVAALQGRLIALEAEVGARAGGLSRARGAAAADLARAVEGELHELGMGSTRFRVNVAQRLAADGVPVELDGSAVRFACDETGVDQVEFLFSANAGEEPRPLARVASGGELARFMLALKSVLSEADETPVLIFDELDQGVGGRMGHVIGEKLWRLSHRHHVLCITHLPQVAAYADAHYVVSKVVHDGRTSTTVDAVHGDRREQELAVMMAGPDVGPATLQSARELLARAVDWKLTAEHVADAGPSASDSPTPRLSEKVERKP